MPAIGDWQVERGAGAKPGLRRTVARLTSISVRREIDFGNPLCPVLGIQGYVQGVSSSTVTGRKTVKATSRIDERSGATPQISEQSIHSKEDREEQEQDCADAMERHQRDMKRLQQGSARQTRETEGKNYQSVNDKPPVPPEKGEPLVRQGQPVSDPVHKEAAGHNAIEQRNGLECERAAKHREPDRDVENKKQDRQDDNEGIGFHREGSVRCSLCHGRTRRLRPGIGRTAPLRNY